MYVRNILAAAALVAAIRAQDVAESRAVETSAESKPAPEEAAPRGVVRSAVRTDLPGLAAAYPGDFGLRADRRVLFVDDFEASPPFVTWTDRHGEAVRLTGEAHAGANACAITVDLKSDPSNWLFKRLPSGEDRVYVRFYVKFPRPAEYLQRFVHLTADEPPRSIPLGGAGVCPDGGRRFSTELLPHARGGIPGAPGFWRLSSYWCEMSISNDGKYWGNAFEAEAPPAVVSDAWTCVEFMVRANSTAAAKDGAQAFWIDGREGAHFEGLRLRTNPRLKVNGLWLLVHATDAAARQKGSGAPAERLTVLFDDVVVATEYIGPRR